MRDEDLKSKTGGGGGGGNGTETPAEYLVRVMHTYGFQPSRTMNAYYVEFTKDYADELGRRARAIVQFEKPTLAHGMPVLSGFQAVVQAAIAPTVAAVEERAPPVMQSDLVKVARVFEGGLEAASVVVRRCEGCGTPVNEFFVVKGRVLCRACK